MYNLPAFAYLQHRLGTMGHAATTLSLHRSSICLFTYKFTMPCLLTEFHYAY